MSTYNFTPHRKHKYYLSYHDNYYHIQQSLYMYFITLYFKTTLITRPPKLVPKFDFVYYRTYILKPPAIYDSFSMVPWVVLK